MTRGAAAGFAVLVLLGGCAKPASAPARSPSPSPRAAGAGPSAGEAPSTGGVQFRVKSTKVGPNYIVLTVQKQNRKSYVLRADSESGVYFGRDTGRSTFVNPHITFYQRTGGTVTADAPAGTLVEKDKTVRMSGGVRARTQDGMTLTSDTLRYDDQTELMHGEGNVVVTSPQGETLRGETLDWNLGSGRIDVDHAH